MASRLAVIGLSLIVVVVAACSAAGSGAAGTGKLTVTDAWARPSPKMALAGAAYLKITNGTGQADALVGVTTPVARSPELHETTADASGVMAMRPVERIEIPAGQTVELKPGSFHVMLIDLTGEFAAGSKIELTLQFEKAGSITVTAEVRAS
jgi:periplasmic copper chaperone A